MSRVGIMVLALLFAGLLLPDSTRGGLVSNNEDNTSPDKAAHFVILGMPRTGSNWLVNMLGQVPNLVCHAEALGLEFYMDQSVAHLWPEEPEGGDQILQQWRRDHLEIFLPEIWSRSGGAAAVGLKVLNVNLDMSNIWQYFLKDRSIKKIIIYRQDLLGMLASWSAASHAEEEGADNAWWGHKTLNTINIDPEWAVTTVRAVLRYYATLMKGLHKEQDYAVVSYEDLISDYQGAVNQLTSWLGVGSGHVIKMATNKQMVNSIEDTVLNIEEVKNALTAVALPHYFSFDENPLAAHRPSSVRGAHKHIQKRRHHSLDQ